MDEESIKLLLVEDNELDQMAFKRFVTNESLKYDCTFASSISEAEKQLAENTYDVVVTDHSLGDGTGIQIIEMVNNAPVIMTTGEGDESVAVKAIKAGAYDYLTKDESSNYLRLLPKIIEGAIRHYQSEKKLNEAEKNIEMLSWVADKTDNAVIISNEKGIVEWVNDGFSKMTGYNSEEVIGKSGETFIQTNLEGVTSGEELISKVIKEKKTMLYEAKRKKKDGNEYWTLTNLIPILYDNGQIHKIALVNSDITARKETEKALEEAKLKAEQSEKAKEMFLANMSHEIRTPMNAIIGFADQLRKTNLTDEQFDYIKTIQLSGDNLMVIINDILDYSKIEAGMMEIETVDFNLWEIVDNVKKLLLPKVDEKGLEFNINIDKDVPEWIAGDPTRLSQVLINLINNAVKFTSEGNVSLKVQVAELSGQNAKLVFQVIDTGIGVPEDKLESIFESFVQSSSETTRKYGGTGLGLTIVKAIIELQEGNIKVQSEIDKGTTFTFEITYAIRDAKQLSESVHREIDANVSADEIGDLNILVVEDNLINQKLAKKVLNDFGFEVDLADNGVSALKVLESKDFDIILMDLQMPEMDGYQTTDHIRNKLEAPKKDIPIVAMTAHAMKSEVDKCKAAGMNDYISKPFDPQNLLNILAKYTGKKSSKKMDTNGTEEKKNETASNSILDMKQLELMSNGSKEFMREIIQDGLIQIPADFENIKKAAAGQNWTSMGSSSHKLRSTVKLLGSNEVSESLHKLEELAENQPTSESVDPLMNDLNDLMPKFISSLNKELEALKVN